MTLIAKAREYQGQYDLVIDLQGLIKTAVFARAISPKVFGFKYPRESLASLLYTKAFDLGEYHDGQHVVTKNFRLIEAVAEELNHQEEAKSINDIEKLQLESLSSSTNEVVLGSSTSHKACFITNTTWQSKHWSPDYWAELSTKLDPDTDLYLSGIPSEQAKLDYIKNLCLNKKHLKPEQIHITTDINLNQLPSFFRQMKTIIGVDTGPLHIAAASVDPAKTQVLGIYGPTSAARSGPYGFKSYSYDEIYKQEASHKRSYEQDSSSILEITPALVEL